MNLISPSLSQYRKTHIVTALIKAYHTPSSTTPHPGTSATCALSKRYGMRKYRGSNKGVGRSTGRTHTGNSKACKRV